MKDEKSIEKADALAKSASNFVEDFYFNSKALQTSKSLVQILNKEDNNKCNQPAMETEFQVTEQSIRDIIKSEVKRLEGQKEQKPGGRLSRKDQQLKSVNKPE